MTALEAAHRAVGGDPARFHHEGFGTAEVPVTLPAVLHPDTASQAHCLRLEPSGKETVVRDGESLLDAALRLGVRIPNSCRKGICGTCFVHKISGEVAMMHQGGIEDDDIEDGGILACCSYPRTPVTLRV
jgi:ferredoxin